MAHHSTARPGLAALDSAALRGAILTGANLRRANLRGADLNRAQLGEACGDTKTKQPLGLTIQPCE